MRTSGTLARTGCVLGALLACAAAANLLGSGEARAATGRLYVKSRPFRARVYLDGEAEPRGTTPCLLRGVPVGRHVLRARLAGYVDVTQEVEVTGGAMGRATLVFTTKTADGVGPDTPAEPEDTSPGSDEPPKYIEIDCPFCGGTGLLQEIGCSACEAAGWKLGEQCNKCGARGKVRHNCLLCEGRGSVTRGGKEVTCPRCKGKGKLPCVACRGAGKLKRPNPERLSRPTAPCPHCAGTGFESEVKCLRCSGRGKLASAPRSAFGSTIGGFGSSGGMTRPTWFDCPFCGGDGKGPPVCRRCRGVGIVGADKARIICQACFGSGRVYSPCRYCRGKGWIKTK